MVYYEHLFLYGQVSRQTPLHVHPSHIFYMGGLHEKSQVRSYDELPLFLNARMVADVLGVSLSSAYVLMARHGFPSVRIGKRYVISRDALRAWAEKEAGADV